MPTVRIVQLLCPERHCVMAMAYLSKDGTAVAAKSEAVNKTFDLAVQRKMLNPWCDLCRSRILHTEDGATRFSSLEEAAPFLEASERAQRVAAVAMKTAKN